MKNINKKNITNFNNEYNLNGNEYNKNGLKNILNSIKMIYCWFIYDNEFFEKLKNFIKNDKKISKIIKKIDKLNVTSINLDNDISIDNTKIDIL